MASVMNFGVILFFPASSVIYPAISHISAHIYSITPVANTGAYWDTLTSFNFSRIYLPILPTGKVRSALAD